ncbi:MAG: SMI1/KNR4 family protein [Gemmataceae bacterium]
MAISELIGLVTPPVHPLDAGDEETVAAIERYLSSSLPTDYVDLVRRYGTGCFGDATFYFWIDNFLGRDGVKSLDQELYFWREGRKLFPKEFTFDLFPARPGYLPCGADVDGGSIAWLVAGTPESWSVVAKSRDGKQFEVFDMPLTTFLAKALTHEIEPDVWPPDFPEDISRVTFVPGEAYHQSVAYRR